MCRARLMGVQTTAGRNKPVKPTPTEKLRDLVKHFETGVLVTHDSPSGWQGRPMAVAEVTDGGDVWFITSDHSAKVREIEVDSRVLIVFQDGWKSCVTIEGHASLVRDPATVQRLWKASFKPWFPAGPDDPDIVLICVRGDRGEYWDNTGLNGLSYLFESIKAITTGTKPEIKEGEQHGLADLRTPVSRY